MLLLVIRHGKASHDSPTGRDRDRTLTARGRSQARWLGERLGELIVPSAGLLASPVTRARETAEIIGTALGIEPVFDERLGTGGDAFTTLEAASDHLRDHLDVATLLLVGHNPHFQELVEQLCRRAAPGPLRTGECVVVEMENRGGGFVQGALRARVRMDEED